MMFLRNAIFAILIVLIKMDASIVDKDLIERINKGEEKAFEVLYNSYFVSDENQTLNKMLVLILISLTLWKRKI